MDCSQRLTQLVRAAKALEDYEKKPEQMEPLKYTELYVAAIRYRAEYTFCCQPQQRYIRESFK